jgi:hypothetical protein
MVYLIYKNQPKAQLKALNDVSFKSPFNIRHQFTFISFPFFYKLTKDIENIFYP